jgi:hypothetical protein
VEFWGKVVWPKKKFAQVMPEEKVGVRPEVDDSIVEARGYLQSMATPLLRGK